MTNLNTKTNYSTSHVSQELIYEIKQALKSVKSFGSVELYVQNGNVTQITVRKIKKTSNFSLQDKN